MDSQKNNKLKGASLGSVHQKMYKGELTCLAAFLFLLCGFAGCIALFCFVYRFTFLALQDWMWLIVCFGLLIGGAIVLFFSLPEEKKDLSPPLPPSFPEYERFMKECKIAFRAHLKLSILFWIVAYRKEKVKSFEDAKKEVFAELKREFGDVRWIESIIEDIRQELYARPPKAN